jgi:alpha-ketoglutarate-dependent taurine dioxygenase
VIQASGSTAAGDVAKWIEEYRQQIDMALREHGAVLFRGFPLKGANDFDAFVRAFHGWEDLSYEKSMSFAVRKRCAGRICTTNEGKSGGLVFHHEQAQTPLWPSKVFFCCQKAAAPGDGGETGLSPSDLVLTRLREKYPAFVEKCEKEGVKYTIYAGPEQDASKGAGRSWKSFFHVQSREECEKVMREGGWEWEWGAGPPGVKVSEQYLKCTTPRLDAVKTAPGTDKKCFFNQLIATTANALEFSKVGTNGGGFDPLKDVPTQDGINACVRFADGDQIDLDILLDAKRLCEENAYDIPWQDGDVALIDNYLVMHARRMWNGPAGTRQLLASLVAEPSCDRAAKVTPIVQSKL